MSLTTCVVLKDEIRVEVDTQGDEGESIEEDEKPAWVDEDDENVTVDIAVTNQLRKLR